MQQALEQEQQFRQTVEDLNRLTHLERGVTPELKVLAVSALGLLRFQEADTIQGTVSIDKDSLSFLIDASAEGLFPTAEEELDPFLFTSTLFWLTSVGVTHLGELEG